MRAIRAKARADTRPPPPLLAQAMAADTDPVFFSRAAWRAPLLLYILRTRLLETRDPGPPTLGLHLRMFLTAGLVDLSLSRDEILRAYVGWAYFGRGCFGAEAAARGYFATDLSRATEAQFLTRAPAGKPAEPRQRPADAPDTSRPDPHPSCECGPHRRHRSGPPGRPAPGPGPARPAMQPARVVILASGTGPGRGSRPRRNIENPALTD
ncbi:MAG: transglycosylase domain-containing protein [Maritimibacter sp.]|nr:transglycosylase domain-containing protein [Maritimibacter sp.]